MFVAGWRCDSEGSQEVQKVLLFRLRKLVELLDASICFGCIRTISTPMLFNSPHQIRRSAVVQEKNAFPETPEWCRTELVSFCLALTYAVVEVWPHLVKRKIRIKIRIFISQLLDRGITRPKHRGMAKGASYITEKRLSFRDRFEPSRGGARRLRWCEQTLEECEFFDITQYTQPLDRIPLRQLPRLRILSCAEIRTKPHRLWGKAEKSMQKRVFNGRILAQLPIVNVCAFLVTADSWQFMYSR